MNFEANQPYHHCDDYLKTILVEKSKTLRK